MTAFALAIALPALLLALPAFSLLVLALAAGRGIVTPTAPASRGRVAVLVPAHNESSNLLPTLASIRAELSPGDRVLVVADNCSDDTADVARAAGAEVVVRQDPSLRGKGYALAFGVDHLRADPCDVVFVVDADCVLRPGSIGRVAARCQSLGRPVQMLNLMHAAPGAGLRVRMLEFAMLFKNKVRPLGTQRLGGACHLMGTGMALPWSLMANARLATGHIAEDMKLGVELAAGGTPAAFSLEGEISSSFPQDDVSAKAQKTRWEHGHLAMLQAELPPLARLALRQRSRALAALALDLMIPPLALYAAVLGAAFACALPLALWLPTLAPAASVLAAACGALFTAVALAWWRHARHLLSATELMRAPLYALWKLPIYLAYAVGRRSGWVRARRASEAAPTQSCSTS